jgi:hypothetical protein
VLRILLLANILLHSTLIYLAITKLKSVNYHRVTLPLAHLFGAYVWEDVLVLSPFWLVSSLVLIYYNSPKLTLVLVLLFVAFRLIFETFYWLFQQFNNTGYRPHDFGFTHLHRQNIYIIYQVMAFSGFVLSLLGLLIILFPALI